MKKVYPYTYGLSYVQNQEMSNSALSPHIALQLQAIMEDTYSENQYRESPSQPQFGYMFGYIQQISTTHGQNKAMEPKQVWQHQMVL